MGDPIYIREMELDDLAEVYALGERLFTAERWPVLHRTWDDYELATMFASDGEFCLVAVRERDEKIVGFVLGTVMFKRRSAWSYGWVIWLGVLPSMKRKGIARRLVDRLTEVFIEAGARMLIVDTDAENAPALRFFERQGFGNRRDHVYMSLNLSTHPKYKKRKPSKKDGRPQPVARPPHAARGGRLEPGTEPDR